MKYNPPFTNSFHFSFVLKKAVSNSSFSNCISYKNKTYCLHFFSVMTYTENARKNPKYF